MKGLFDKKRQGRGRRPKEGGLTREIAGIIIGLVAGTVALCWVLNTVFLERYYVMNKENVLLSGFTTIDAASEDGSLDDSSFDVTFDNLCANGNITVMVISPDRTIVRSSVNDTQRMLIEFTDIIFGGTQNETTVLAQAEDYVIQRRTDTRLDAEYLVLYGTLSNGNLVLMRSALESIRESAKTSNQFLLYVGILAIAVSTVVSVFISKRITDPILELTEISKHMTQLEFEVCYTPKGKRRNEIDELGTHMNEMSQALEHTISELKSANNQLLLDIEKKTQIDRQRKEFLSNVSHELKTPLALIQGYAEGLKECINDDAESRDFYCEVIMDEAAKMNNMVKKLLTLNHLESGKDAIVFERFDLTKLVRTVVHSAELLADQKGAKILFEETESHYVWADEFKTEEVVTNFVSNAINHVDFDKVIEIKMKKENGKVHTSVFNTGVPIPEADIDKIWIKFYKVDKARTREYGGSGIGLSIVKAIMDSMHQKFGVKNYDNGVEFWFELEADNGREMKSEMTEEFAKPVEVKGEKTEQNEP